MKHNHRMQIVKMMSAEKLLSSILEDWMFNEMLKDDDRWNSEHDKEAKLLGLLRMRLSCLNDDLWSVMSVIRQALDA